MVRGWPPYFQLHRLSKRLDTLPAWTGAGYDFEFCCAGASSRVKGGST